MYNIDSRGLRTTVCGTDGFSDLVFVLSTVWTLVMYTVVPLVLPIILVFFASRSKRAKK
ncbi:hypothetical protein KR50_14490 [Jeotgalibacillus campisalis]|uniref:Uncharacterized protein n=1 Tax=Jeotgalibacillus campisalis TaxID=220754 RepID=A0A0C2VWR4_9BACL|nr:hypothetical protein KR50_14490 [Jeotgalibacillus campisalis]